MRTKAVERRPGRPETQPKAPVQRGLLEAFNDTDYMMVVDEQVIRDILDQCDCRLHRQGFLLVMPNAAEDGWREVWTSGPNRIPVIDWPLTRLV